MAEPHTLTFLFTDVEGSTFLWERNPKAMSEALVRHEEILRTTIEAHEGHVFKTVGDAFYAAFPLAPKALSAALDAQRALHHGNYGPERSITRQEHVPLPRLTDRIAREDHDADALYRRRS